MDALRGLGALGIGSRLKRLSDHLMRDSQVVYDYYNIDFDPYLFPIIRMIATNTSITNNEIKEALNYTQPAVTQAINKLKKKEYVVVTTDKIDKRKKCINLTQKGASIIKHMEPLWKAFEVSIEEITSFKTDSLTDLINTIENRIEEKSFSETILEHAKTTMKPTVEIVHFQPKYAHYFYDLNIEWLETYFYVEDYDREVLSKPETYILNKGGYIFFAKYKGEVVGTVALMPTNEEGVLELTKMAVSPELRGHKIGQLLMQHCIDFAKQQQVKALMLYSNRILENAIYIYRKYGFIELPLEPDSPYKRSNIKMELKL